MRRRVSKPGQSPPPHTGAAAWPSSPSGALHTSGAVSLRIALLGAIAVHSNRGLTLSTAAGVLVGVVGSAGSLCETGVTFARVCQCGAETGIAFARSKRLILASFLPAVVSLVSRALDSRRAVVLSVSSLLRQQGVDIENAIWESAFQIRRSDGSDTQHSGRSVSGLPVPNSLCYYLLLSQSCVAQRQSIRLLIGRLLVRIQPQELSPRPIRVGGFVVCGASHEPFKGDACSEGPCNEDGLAGLRYPTFGGGH